LNGIEENMMIEKTSDVITMKAEHFVTYLESHEGFDKHDFAELFCDGYVARVDEFRKNSPIHIIGTINMPEKVFDATVDFRGLIISKLICGETCFDNGFHVENVKSELRLGTAFYEGSVVINNCSCNVFFESANFENVEIVINNLRVGDQKFVPEINFGSASFMSVTSNQCYCSIDFDAATFNILKKVVFSEGIIFNINFGTASFGTLELASKIIANEVYLDNFGAMTIKLNLDRVKKLYCGDGFCDLYMRGLCEKVIVNHEEAHNLNFVSATIGSIHFRSSHNHDRDSNIVFGKQVTIDSAIFFEGNHGCFPEIEVDDEFNCIMDFSGATFDDVVELSDFVKWQENRGNLILFKRDGLPLNISDVKSD
jgi:hypothetical protein